MPLSDLSHEQVAVIVTLKFIKKMVEHYKGKPQDMRKWLMKELTDLDERSDQILADSFRA